MNVRLPFVSLVLALSFALVACAVPSSATVVVAGLPEKGDAGAPVNTDFAQRLDGFGFDVLGRVAAEKTNGNIVVSPVSVSAALAMLAGGADGATRDEIRAALRTDGLEDADADLAYANLMRRLQVEQDGVTLDVRNALFADEGAAIEPTFAQWDREYFGAEVRTLDFASPGAVKAINSWVKESTRGRIPKIVDTIGPLEIAHILNAVYFLGDWEKPFDKRDTEDATFHAPDGDVETPMMLRGGDGMRYADGDGFRGVALPYKGGKQCAYILLPDEGSTPEALVASLEATAFPVLAEAFTEKEGTLRLPRFETKFRTDLVDALKAIGIRRVFAPETSDLSRLTSLAPAWVGFVTHSTYLRVDEKGTEAAAVTDIGILAAGAPADPFELTVDRPFVFVVYDEPSGTVLFASIIRDPSATK